MKTSVIVTAIIIAILLMYCVYRCCYRKSGVKVKYFYSPGCPHCRNFMAAWDQFASQASSKADVEKVNCATHPQLCAGIRGVPHVVFSVDNKEVVYPGERTPGALYNFLERFST